MLAYNSSTLVKQARSISTDAADRFADTSAVASEVVDVAMVYVRRLRVETAQRWGVQVHVTRADDSACCASVVAEPTTPLQPTGVYYE